MSIHLHCTSTVSYQRELFQVWIPSIYYFYRRLLFRTMLTVLVILIQRAEVQIIFVTTVQLLVFTLMALVAAMKMGWMNQSHTDMLHFWSGVRLPCSNDSHHSPDTHGLSHCTWDIKCMKTKIKNESLVCFNNSFIIKVTSMSHLFLNCSIGPDSQWLLKLNSQWKLLTKAYITVFGFVCIHKIKMSLQPNGKRQKTFNRCNSRDYMQWSSNYFGKLAAI